MIGNNSGQDFKL